MKEASNSIWKITKPNGDQVTGFTGIAHKGTEHFKNIFKSDGRTSIAEILKVASDFHNLPMIRKMKSNSQSQSD